VIGLTEKVDIINMYFNQGMTQKEVAEKVGRCIKTVRKYIRQHEENLKKLEEDHTEENKL